MTCDKGVPSGVSMFLPFYLFFYLFIIYFCGSGDVVGRAQEVSWVALTHHSSCMCHPWIASFVIFFFLLSVHNHFQNG